MGGMNNGKRFASRAFIFSGKVWPFLADKHIRRIMGYVLVRNVIGTFLPRLQLYSNPVLTSFIAWLIPSILFIALFADDAKRHTAYGRYNPALVSTVMIVTAATYYVPAIVMGYVKDMNAAAMIRELYFSSFWISSFVGDDVEIYGLIGVILSLFICVLSYITARKIYLRKFEKGEYEYEYNR